MTPHIWRDRFEDIRDIERYLTRNGTVIRKIFLNVSKAEQRRRFLMRLHNPDKRWKFSINDINERLRWKEYMAAYEEAMRVTSTEDAPWYVVPADNKWFTRLAVAADRDRDAREPETQGADAVTQGHPSVEPRAAPPALQIQVASPARRLTPPGEGPTIRE